VELEAGPAHHVGKVLRMQAGRELVLFNGNGGEYAAVITEASKRHVSVAIGEYREPDTESPLVTELAIGVSRGERMDWVIQKATELGVTRIQPLFTERTEVKLNGDRLEKRLQHWQQVIVSACEQCQRNRLPELRKPLVLPRYLESCDTLAKYVLHHRTDQQLKETAKPESVSLLVGPEGGLSDDEILLAQHHNFKALALGPRVMRTETAPVAALAVMQFHWGDF
jgi:16S rRNA (uracil1498-N3)-methyltransferase